MNITINNNIIEYTDCKTIPFDTGVKWIKDGKYKNLINLHRKFSKFKFYGGFIKKSLPKIIFDGVYSERTKRGLVGELNGLMTIDFDDVPIKCKERLKFLVNSLTKPSLLFDSVSPDGFKSIYLTDITNPVYFEHAQKYLIESISKELKPYQLVESFEYKIDYVPHSLGFFISYDTNLIQNKPTPLPLLSEAKIRLEKEITLYKTYKPKVTNANQTEIVKTLEEILYKLETNNICITDSYFDWQTVGFSIFNEVTDNDIASDLFMRYSELSDKFNVKECEKECRKFIRLRNTSKNKAGIGKIIYLMNNN